MYWQNSAGSHTKLVALGLIWKETKKNKSLNQLWKLIFLINVVVLTIGVCKVETRLAVRWSRKEISKTEVCPQILDTRPSLQRYASRQQVHRGQVICLEQAGCYFIMRNDSITTANELICKAVSESKIELEPVGCRRDLQINKQFKIIFVDKFVIDGWVRICPTFLKFMRLMKKLGALRLLVHTFRASFIKQSHVIRLSLVFSSPLQQSVEFFRFFHFGVYLKLIFSETFFNVCCVIDASCLIYGLCIQILIFL